MRGAKRARSKVVICIAVWLILNGVALIGYQGTRLLGHELSRMESPGPGYEAMDYGITLLDVIPVGPLYILAAVLLWRGHRLGPILAVAALIQLTYVMAVFALAFTKAGWWPKVPTEDAVFFPITFLINAFALGYLLRKGSHEAVDA